jgi:hypothetical protein
MIADESFADSIAEAGGIELLRAVEQEYRLGWEREKMETLMAQQRMATACTQLESAAIDGLGHIESDIPASAYFHWMNEGRKRGEANIWRHAEFRREFLRDNPQYKVRYRRKPMTGYRGDPLAKAAAEAEARRRRTLILT